MKIKLFVAPQIPYSERGMFSFNSYFYYLTRGFIAQTRTFNCLTRAFNLLTRRAFDLATRAFSVLTREFELLTCWFKLLTLWFKLATHGFELVTPWIWTRICGFELATLQFGKFHRKTPKLASFFNKVPGLKISNFIKKTLHHMFFLRHLRNF